MPNKTHLNIFLIKENISSEINIIKRYDERVEISKSLILFICKAKEKVPSWVETFFPGIYQLNSLRTSTASVLLLMKMPSDGRGSRYFALPFGYGRHMLDPESIETRFGLKTVLNALEDNAVRKIDTTNIAGSARKKSEQMPTRSAFSEFSIDIERDLLEGVTATISGLTPFEGTVTGKDSLSGNSEITVDSILCSLPSLLKVYESDKYKALFSWVDQITPVKDKPLIERLEEIAVKKIIDCSLEIWMTVPEVIKWEDIRGFKCPGLNDEAMDDIDIAKVKSSFKKGLSSFAQLKKKQISALRADNDSPQYQWSACRCLYGEIEYEGNLYCLSNGNWYLIDRDYSKKVESDYSKATISDIPFIDYTTQSGEEEYNKKLAESNVSKFILMDKKMICHGAGRSSVELCDVYDRSGKFIHVKKNSGSAALSHLYNQGLVSARLMKADSEFASKASAKLSESATEPIDIGPEDMREVVYGIISKIADKKLPKVPFFSKVTYLSVAQQLKAMDIKVSIAAIQQLTRNS